MNALLIAIKVRTVMWRVWWMLPKGHQEYAKRGIELASLRRDFLLLGLMYRTVRAREYHD